MNPEVIVSIQRASHYEELPSRSGMLRWIRKACETEGSLTVRFVDEE